MSENRWTFSPQEGARGHCSVAQVWDENGVSLATFEPTDDPAVATNRAQMSAVGPDLYDVAKAYEAWEADVILNADWGSDLPTLTQAQWDRMIEIQSMRNAALEKVHPRNRSEDQS